MAYLHLVNSEKYLLDILFAQFYACKDEDPLRGGDTSPDSVAKDVDEYSIAPVDAFLSHLAKMWVALMDRTQLNMSTIEHLISTAPVMYQHMLKQAFKLDMADKMYVFVAVSRSLTGAKIYQLERTYMETETLLNSYSTNAILIAKADECKTQRSSYWKSASAIRDASHKGFLAKLQTDSLICQPMVKAIRMIQGNIPSKFRPYKITINGLTKYVEQDLRSDDEESPKMKKKLCTTAGITNNVKSLLGKLGSGLKNCMKKCVKTKKAYYSPVSSDTSSNSHMDKSEKSDYDEDLVFEKTAILKKKKKKGIKKLNRKKVQDRRMSLAHPALLVERSIDIPVESNQKNFDVFHNINNLSTPSWPIPPNAWAYIRRYGLNLYCGRFGVNNVSSVNDASVQTIPLREIREEAYVNVEPSEENKEEDNGTYAHASIYEQLNALTAEVKKHSSSVYTSRIELFEDRLSDMLSAVEEMVLTVNETIKMSVKPCAPLREYGSLYPKNDDLTEAIHNLELSGRLNHRVELKQMAVYSDKLHNRLDELEARDSWWASINQDIVEEFSVQNADLTSTSEFPSIPLAGNSASILESNTSTQSVEKFDFLFGKRWLTSESSAVSRDSVGRSKRKQVEGIGEEDPIIREEIKSDLLDNLKVSSQHSAPLDLIVEQVESSEEIKEEIIIPVQIIESDNQGIGLGLGSEDGYGSDTFFLEGLADAESAVALDLGCSSKTLIMASDKIQDKTPLEENIRLEKWQVLCEDLELEECKSSTSEQDSYNRFATGSNVDYDHFSEAKSQDHYGQLEEEEEEAEEELSEDIALLTSSPSKIKANEHLSSIMRLDDAEYSKLKDKDVNACIQELREQKPSLNGKQLTEWRVPITEIVKCSGGSKNPKEVVSQFLKDCEESKHDEIRLSKLRFVGTVDYYKSTSLSARQASKDFDLYYRTYGKSISSPVEASDCIEAMVYFNRSVPKSLQTIANKLHGSSICGATPHEKNLKIINKYAKNVKGSKIAKIAIAHKIKKATGLFQMDRATLLSKFLHVQTVSTDWEKCVHKMVVKPWDIKILNWDVGGFARRKIISPPGDTDLCFFYAIMQILNKGILEHDLSYEGLKKSFVEKFDGGIIGSEATKLCQALSIPFYDLGNFYDSVQNGVIPFKSWGLVFCNNIYDQTRLCSHVGYVTPRKGNVPEYPNTYRAFDRYMRGIEENANGVNSMIDILTQPRGNFALRAISLKKRDMKDLLISCKKNKNMSAKIRIFLDKGSLEGFDHNATEKKIALEIQMQSIYITTKLMTRDYYFPKTIEGALILARRKASNFKDWIQVTSRNLKLEQSEIISGYTRKYTVNNPTAEKVVLGMVYSNIPDPKSKMGSCMKMYKQEKSKSELSIWFPAEKVNVRMISSRAVIESSETTLLTLYSHPRKLASDIESTKKYEYSPLSCVPMPRGHINPNQVSYLASCTGISSAVLRKSATQHSGHPFLRYMNDVVAWDNLGRAVKYCYTPEANKRGVLMVDIGAKFLSISNHIDHMWKKTDKVLKVNIKRLIADKTDLTLEELDKVYEDLTNGVIDKVDYVTKYSSAHTRWAASMGRFGNNQDWKDIEGLIIQYMTEKEILDHYATPYEFEDMRYKPAMDFWLERPGNFTLVHDHERTHYFVLWVTDNGLVIMDSLPRDMDYYRGWVTRCSTKNKNMSILIKTVPKQKPGDNSCGPHSAANLICFLKDHTLINKDETQLFSRYLEYTSDIDYEEPSSILPEFEENQSGLKWYVGVRPWDNDYDDVYYKLNLSKYDKRVESSTGDFQFKSMIKGKIQDANTTQNIYRLMQEMKAITGETPLLAYFMNDVHYYLGEWVPALEGVHFISGGLFPVAPALGYILPCSEGDFDVYASDCAGKKMVKQMIRMHTGKAGGGYSHPNVTVRVDTLFDFGWYKIGRTVVSSKHLDIRTIYQPSNLMSSGNPQKNFYDLVVGLPEEEHVFKRKLRYHIESTGEGIMGCLKNFFIDKRSPLNSHRYRDFRMMMSGQEIQIDRKSWWRKFFRETLSKLCWGDRNVNSLYLARKEVLKPRPDWVQDRIIFGATGIKATNKPLQDSVEHKPFSIKDIYDVTDVESLIHGPKIVPKIRAAVKSHHKFIKKDAVIYKSVPSSTIVAANSYYQVKSVTPEEIIMPGIDILDKRFVEYTKKMTQAVRTYIRNNPHNDIPDKPVNITKTGFDVKALGSPVIEYEYSSKSSINSLISLFTRQFSWKLTPDDVHLGKFSKMCHIFWTDFFHHFEDEYVQYIKFDTEWLEGKKEWTATKKAKYLETLVRQKSGSTHVYIGNFKTMVKTGEVFKSLYELKFDKHGCIIERDDRPRNISVPDSASWGTLTAIQACFWKAIKKACPGFIQGLTKKEMLDLFKDQITILHLSLCLDGSGFDSSQKACLMKCTDNEFWIRAKPYILKLLKVNDYVCPEKAVEDIVKDATKTKAMMFTKIPGINGPSFSPEMTKAFKRVNPYSKVSSPEQDWICSALDGTTFSGHPTRTTLGNTFRSLLYMYYYIEEAGIKKPWRHYKSWECCNNFTLEENIFVAASGDDVVLWAPPHLMKDITASVEKLTSKKKDQALALGLGQCVKVMTVSSWHDIDFWSKLSFCDNPNNLDSWTLTRDFRKLLTETMYYTGQNLEIHNNPIIHALALQDCIKAEQVSKSLERLMEIRIEYLKKRYDDDSSWPALMIAKDKLVESKYSKYYLSDAKDNYRFQEEIDEMLDLNIGTILIARRANTINVRPSLV
jgi:hypothetical protein